MAVVGLVARVGFEPTRAQPWKLPGNFSHPHSLCGIQTHAALDTQTSRDQLPLVAVPSYKRTANITHDGICAYTDETRCREGGQVCKWEELQAAEEL